MGYFESIFAGSEFRLYRSPESVAALSAIELTRSMRLPAAFAELWSFEGIVNFLHAYTNTDHPIPATRLNDGVRSRWPGHDPLAAGYLPFMIENQGVTTWAIKLGASDDPRVYVEVDSGSPPTWQLHASSLTDWMRCILGDRKMMRQGIWWSAQAVELTAENLTRLQQRFTQGLTTYAWPGRENLRFTGSTGDILLWNSEGQTDWMIAPTAGQEAELLDSIFDLSDLSHSLYSWPAQAQGLLEGKRRGMKR